MATKVTLRNVTVSYVQVWEAKASENNPAKKYSLTILIPKTDGLNYWAARKAIEEAYEKGVQNPKKFAGQRPTVWSNPLHDGDIERDLTKYPECQNMFYINARAEEDKPPRLVDRQQQPVTDPNMIYSGSICNVVVDFYPFVKSGNKGIACSLLGVQFVSDGIRLAGSVASNADFDVYDDFANTCGVPPLPQY